MACITFKRLPNTLNKVCILFFMLRVMVCDDCRVTFCLLGRFILCIIVRSFRLLVLLQHLFVNHLMVGIVIAMRARILQHGLALKIHQQSIDDRESDSPEDSKGLRRVSQAHHRHHTDAYPYPLLRLLHTEVFVIERVHQQYTTSQGEEHTYLMRDKNAIQENGHCTQDQNAEL